MGDNQSCWSDVCGGPVPPILVFRGNETSVTGGGSVSLCFGLPSVALSLHGSSASVFHSSPHPKGRLDRVRPLFPVVTPTTPTRWVLSTVTRCRMSVGRRRSLRSVHPLNLCGGFRSIYLSSYFTNTFYYNYLATSLTDYFQDKMSLSRPKSFRGPRHNPPFFSE